MTPRFDEISLDYFDHLCLQAGNTTDGAESDSSQSVIMTSSPSSRLRKLSRTATTTRRPLHFREAASASSSLGRRGAAGSVQQLPERGSCQQQLPERGSCQQQLEQRRDRIKEFVERLSPKKYGGAASKEEEEEDEGWLVQTSRSHPQQVRK